MGSGGGGSQTSVMVLTPLVWAFCEVPVLLIFGAGCVSFVRCFWLPDQVALPARFLTSHDGLDPPGLGVLWSTLVTTFWGGVVRVVCCFWLPDRVVF